MIKRSQNSYKYFVQNLNVKTPSKNTFRCIFKTHSKKKLTLSKNLEVHGRQNVWNSDPEQLWLLSHIDMCAYGFMNVCVCTILTFYFANFIKITHFECFKFKKPPNLIGLHIIVQVMNYNECIICRKLLNEEHICVYIWASLCRGISTLLAR